MIIYIAGPMTGYPNWNMDAFAESEAELSLMGHTVLNPAKHTPIIRPELITHAEYMRIAIAMLDCCDAIYLLRGWQESVGANAEYRHAVANGKAVMYQNEPCAAP